MKPLSLFINAVSWVNDKIGRLFVCYLIFLMFLLLIFEIVARYGFGSPTVWAGELTQMLFGAFVMLSGGYLMLNKGHIYVEIIYERFSTRTKAVVDLVTSLLFFAFVLVLLKEGWYMAEESVALLESSNSAWDPAIWPLKLCIPIGSVLLLLQGVAKTIQDLQIIFCPSIACSEGLDNSEHKGA